MRDLSTLRWSFIWRLRLRSTAMWVILWLSTSSLFLVGFVLLRFLLSLVTGGDFEFWVVCFNVVCELLTQFSTELGCRSWLRSEVLTPPPPPSGPEVECGYWRSLASDLIGECNSTRSFVTQLSNSSP